MMDPEATFAKQVKLDKYQVRLGREDIQWGDKDIQRQGLAVHGRC
jgi:hypothetical protein